MKFTEYLKKHHHPSLQYFYIDYPKLKEVLKKCKSKNEFTNTNESLFVSVLDEEMQRVWDYVSVKQGELTRRSIELEKDAKKVFIQNNENSSKDSRFTEKDIIERNKQLKDDITQLSEFINTNIIGFNKILKRHDKYTSFILRPMYKNKLKMKLNEVESNNELLYRISKISLTTDLKSINDLNEKHSSKSKSKPNKKNKNIISGQKFVRKTKKYWVHRENLMQLKCKILKHLPIYVFTSQNNQEENQNTNLNFPYTNDISLSGSSELIIPQNTTLPNISLNSSFQSKNNTTTINSPYHQWDHKNHDTCISSVYFDNTNFDLYKGRLNKHQGAEAIRIRWYGKKMTKNVFIERKKHEEDWTGEESKKLRFKIPENKVNDYIQGKNVWKDVEKLLNTSQNDDKDDTFVLYNEIQNSIVNKKLVPMTRTFYKRAAFQLPNSAKVRISLDTDLCMIKENLNFNYQQENHKNWRRKDVDCEYPFHNLKKDDIVRFPYAILEIKLESLDNQECLTSPKWIEELENSSLIEHVHKFSKFIHGTAILYPLIDDIPYWLPQMNSEIRKEYRNKFSKIFSNDGVMIDNKNINYDRENTNGNKKSINYNRNGIFSLNDLDKNKEYNEINNINKDTDVLTDSSKIMNIEIEDKRIAIPVRVEPKVFFANERTFLSWLHFSIFIGGIGTAMMGLGDTHAKYSGMVFIGTSAIFAIYALYLYFWRATKIRVKDPGPYDDFIGPAVLVGVFLCAMVLSIYFKFPMH